MFCLEKRKKQGGEAIFKTGTDTLKGFFIGELFNFVTKEIFVCTVGGGRNRKKMYNIEK